MVTGFLDIIQADMHAVDDIIEKNLKIKPGHLSKFAHIDKHTVKRTLLPAMILLTGRMFDYKDKKLIHLAATVEMIFLATDIHFAISDDNNPYFEGIDPRDGARLPVLAGDLLYGLYFAELGKGNILQFLDPLSKVVAEMNCGALTKVKRGAYRDNHFALEIIYKETAILFQKAVEMACQLAGVKEADWEHLSEFGHNIGLAYGLLERDYGQESAKPYFAKAFQALHAYPANPAREAMVELLHKLSSGELAVPVRKNLSIHDDHQSKELTVNDSSHLYTDKEEYLNSIFSAIAKQYDILNTVLSLNQDKYWRKFTVEQTGVRAGSKALDVCCGTGMMTIELAKKVGPQGEVIGLDINEEMLETARRHIKGSPYENAIHFVKGNAMELPYPDNTFDCVTIGFGLHNVTDMRRVLAESIRVLKPGHSLVCLDFGKPTVPVFKQIYELYFGKWVPFLTKLGVGQNGPLGFLHRMWNRAPRQKELMNELGRLGMQNTTYYDLTGGVVAVHVGTKPIEHTLTAVAATRE